MKKLDRSRPYGEVFGGGGIKYEQDALSFGPDEVEIQETADRTQELENQEDAQPTYDWERLAAERAAIPLNKSNPWGQFEQMLYWPNKEPSESNQGAIQNELPLGKAKGGTKK